jgi:hypothetical protein
MKRNGQRPRGNGKENPRSFYAAGHTPGSATLVRGSSRRIMTMKASFGSILEYQTDQPSIQLPGPLTDPLHPKSVQAMEIAVCRPALVTAPVAISTACTALLRGP